MAHPKLYRIRVDNFTSSTLRTEYMFGHDKAHRLAENFIREMQLTMSTGIVRLELYKHNQWGNFSTTRITEGRITDNAQR